MTLRFMLENGFGGGAGGGGGSSKPVTLLSITTAPTGTFAKGSKYYDSTTKKIYTAKIADSWTGAKEEEPKFYTVYIYDNNGTTEYYQWDGDNLVSTNLENFIEKGSLSINNVVLEGNKSSAELGIGVLNVNYIVDDVSDLPVLSAGIGKTALVYDSLTTSGTYYRYSASTSWQWQTYTPTKLAVGMLVFASESQRVFTISSVSYITFYYSEVKPTDSALSSSSKNPVQNKVVTQALNNKNDIFEKVTTITENNGTVTVPLALGNRVYKVAPTADFNLVIDKTNLNIPANTIYTFSLWVDTTNANAACEISNQDDFQWGNTSPTMTANVNYHLVFTTYDGGTTWVGNQCYSWQQ